MTLSIPVSFEFFPPKTTEGEEKLMHTVSELATHNPEFFSVTYGAGGSTQAGTFNAVANIRAQGFEAAPIYPALARPAQTHSIYSMNSKRKA